MSEPEPESEPEPGALHGGEQQDGEQEELPYSSAAEAKAAGTAAFKAKQYHLAVSAFTWAIQLDATQPAFYTNRSWSYTQLGDFVRAKADGLRAAELDQSLGKGYLRAGQAINRMPAGGCFKEALDLFAQAAEGALTDGALNARAARAEVAHARGKLDLEMEKGTQIYIGGMGRGVVCSGYTKKLFGSNEHCVQLRSGPPRSGSGPLKLKLKELWWSALPDEMEEMESQSASTTEREATKLAVELAAQAKRELVESEFATIAAEATEEQAAAAGAVLRVKGCTDKRVNGWYKESGVNQSGKMTYSKADGTSGGIFFGKEVTGQLMWQIRLTSHYSVITGESKSAIVCLVKASKAEERPPTSGWSRGTRVDFLDTLPQKGFVCV